MERWRSVLGKLMNETKNKDVARAIKEVIEEMERLRDVVATNHVNRREVAKHLMKANVKLQLFSTRGVGKWKKG